MELSLPFGQAGLRARVQEPLQLCSLMSCSYYVNLLLPTGGMLVTSYRAYTELPRVSVRGPGSALKVGAAPIWTITHLG